MEDLCKTLSKITLPLDSFYIRNREFTLVDNPNKVYTLNKGIEDSPLHHTFLDKLYCDIPADQYIYIQSGWINNYVIFNDQLEYFYNEPKNPVFNNPAKTDLTTIENHPFAKSLFVVSSVRDLIVLESQKIPAVFVTPHTVSKLKNDKKELILIYKWNESLYNEIRQVIQNQGIKAWTIWDKSADLFELLHGTDSSLRIYRQFWNKLSDFFNEHKQEIVLTANSIFDDSMFLQESKADIGYRISSSKSSDKAYMFTNFIIKYVDFSNADNGSIDARVDIFLRNKAVIKDIILPMDIFISIDKFKAFFYSLSPEIFINNVKKAFAPVILERLRELILNNSKPVVRHKLTRIGYNMDLNTSIYPSWSTSNQKNNAVPFLVSFDFGDIARISYPELASVDSKPFDNEFTEIMKDLLRSMGYDPDSNLNNIVGPMLFAWALCTFYVQFAMRDVGKFPQFDLFGSAKRGKTFNSIILNEAFGLPSPKMSPSSTTIAGLSRLMNMYSNGYLVLDEFTRKSCTNEKVYDGFVSMIRSNYDGSSRILGSKIDNSSISQVKMGIPVLMIGESMIEDNALRSRCICLQVDNPALSNNDSTYSDHILDLAKKLRPYMKYFIEQISENNWNKYYQQIQIVKEIMKKKNSFMESRDIDVWSMPIPFARPFFKTEKEYKNFIKSVIGQIQDTKFVMQQDDVFTIISNFCQYCLHDKFDNDFLYKDGCKFVFDSNRFYFSASEIYNTALLYEKKFGIKNVVISSADTFMEILKKKPYYVSKSTISNYNNKKRKMCAISWTDMPANTLSLLIQLHCAVTDEDIDMVMLQVSKFKDMTEYNNEPVELPENEEKPKEDDDKSDPLLDAIRELE